MSSTGVYFAISPAAIVGVQQSDAVSFEIVQEVIRAVLHSSAKSVVYISRSIRVTNSILSIVSEGVRYTIIQYISKRIISYAGSHDVIVCINCVLRVDSSRSILLPAISKSVIHPCEIHARF